jgi:magnesium chelatase family protein
MLTPALKSELVRIIERLRLSARAYDKVLRVARTVADLAASEAVRLEDLAAAGALRRLDDEEYSFLV